MRWRLFLDLGSAFASTFELCVSCRLSHCSAAQQILSYVSFLPTQQFPPAVRRSCRERLEVHKIRQRQLNSRRMAQATAFQVLHPSPCHVNDGYSDLPFCNRMEVRLVAQSDVCASPPLQAAEEAAQRDPMMPAAFYRQVATFAAGMLPAVPPSRQLPAMQAATVLAAQQLQQTCMVGAEVQHPRMPSMPVQSTMPFIPCPHEQARQQRRLSGGLGNAATAADVPDNFADMPLELLFQMQPPCQVKQCCVEILNGGAPQCSFVYIHACVQLHCMLRPEPPRGGRVQLCDAAERILPHYPMQVLRCNYACGPQVETVLDWEAHDMSTMWDEPPPGALYIHHMMLRIHWPRSVMLQRIHAVNCMQTMN